MHSLKNQIIVARYNENINWLLKYKDLTTIYNKGPLNIPKIFNIINLPNFGREGHTYLYHIISNYDNLADKTLFIQAKIDDHQTFFIEDYFKNDCEFIGKNSRLNINELKKEINHGKKWKIEKESGAMRPSIYTPYKWLVDLIGIEIKDLENDFDVIWGANFSVSKNLIHKKPKIFYQNILRYLDYHKNPEEGHFLERCWKLIFMNEFFPKKVIDSIFIKNLSNYQNNKINNINNINNINKNISNNLMHIWIINDSNNLDYKNYKIGLIPSYSTFFEFKPKIINNSFTLYISTYIHFKILNNNCGSCYEIIFDNNSSIIIFNNNILQSYSSNTNGLKFNKKMMEINFSFEFSNEKRMFIVKNKENIIFNIIDNLPIHTLIENENYTFSIKNISESDLLLDYESDLLNDTINDSIKLFFVNNNYNKDYGSFYINNYLDYYINYVN